MRFTKGQTVASPIKVTVRDESGNKASLAAYDLAQAEIHDPMGIVSTVPAQKTTNDVLVNLPTLSTVGKWHFFIVLSKNGKTDYSERIEFEVWN